MKLSRTAIKELKSRYYIIMKKCIYLNAVIFAGLTSFSGVVGAAPLPSDLTVLTRKDPTDDIRYVQAPYTDSTYGGRLLNDNGDLTFYNSYIDGFSTDSSGGAIYNYDTIKFMTNPNVSASTYLDKTTFIQNSAQDGAAIYNSGGNATITFEKSLFQNNTILKASNAIYPVGSIVNNAAGTINFGKETTFQNHTLELANGSIVYNTGTLNFFGSASFLNNTITSQGYIFGGAIYNYSTIVFEGRVNFERNIVNAGIENVYGYTGAIYNTGKITFNNNATQEDAYDLFSSNSALETGGAIYNSDTITFNSNVKFQDNSVSIGGAGAIYNDAGGTITFNKKAFFIGNTANNSPQDIHNDGTINFGTQQSTSSVDDTTVVIQGGFSGTGTINKYTAGELDLTGSNNLKYLGSFNQYAGTTKADSRAFFQGENKIYAGELITEGNHFGYKVTLETTNSSAGKLTHTASKKDDNTYELINLIDVVHVKSDGLENNHGILTTFINGEYQMNNSLDFNATNKMTAEDTVSFQNALVQLSSSVDYGKATYSFDENSIIDLRTGGIGATELTNMSDSGATLAFELSFAGTGSSLQFLTDTFSTQSSYTVNLNTDYIDLINFTQDNGLNETYTAKVLDGNAKFDTTSFKDTKLVATDVYQYKIGLDSQDANNQTIELSAIKAADGNSLKAVNQYQGDSTFNLSLSESASLYQMDESLGVTGKGEKHIFGNVDSNGNLTKTIVATGKTMFDFSQDEEQTKLFVENVIISGAKSVLDSSSATGNDVVELNNVKVLDSSLTDTLFKNAGTTSLTFNMVEIASGIVENDSNFVVSDTKLSALKNSGEVQFLGENIIKDSFSNDGKVFLKSDSSLKLAQNMTGSGLLHAQNALLILPDEFSTSNNLMAENLSLSNNVKKLNTNNLNVIENSHFNIKNINISANVLTLEKESTLFVDLHNLSDFGSISGQKIVAQEGSKINFNLDQDFEAGIYHVFQMADIQSLPTIVQNDGNYYAIDLENGMYSFILSDSANTQEHFGSDENQTNVIEALHQGKGDNDSFNQMQKEVLNALQSNDSKKRKESLKAMDAIGGNFSPILQSIYTEHYQAIASSLNLENSLTLQGRSSGDETPRSMLSIKGLYSRTKDTGSDHYKIYSTGGILSIKTRLTDDFLVGLGYAYASADVKQTNRDTDADNNTVFAYFKYQPNKFSLNGLFGYTRGQYDERKTILSTKGYATYNVDSVVASLLAGYNFEHKNIVITPKVGLRYMQLSQESYKDSLGTHTNKNIYNYLTALSGIEVQAPFKSWKGYLIRPTFETMVAYDVVSDDMNSVNTLSNNASYFIKGESLPQFSTFVNAGLEAQISANSSLLLEYNGSFRRSYQNHGGMLRFEMNF